MAQVLSLEHRAPFCTILGPYLKIGNENKKVFLFNETYTEGDENILMESRSKIFIVGQGAMSGKKSDTADNFNSSPRQEIFKPVMKHTIYYVISNNWVLVLQAGNFVCDNKELSVARFGETVDCENS